MRASCPIVCLLALATAWMPLDAGAQISLDNFGSAPAEPASPQPLEPEARRPPQQAPALTTWRSDELRVAFSYTSGWKQATPKNKSTHAVINWRLPKSGTLIATCYVEASEKGATPLARASIEDFRRNAGTIARSVIRNFKEKAPDAELVSWRLVSQDEHPVIYMIRNGTFDIGGEPLPVQLYSLLTTWNQHEVNFECATAVVGREFEALDNGPEMIKEVEKLMLNVLRTLKFERN